MVAETQGFPDLTTVPPSLYGENFDATVASGQGILVTDTTGSASPFVIPMGFQFTLATRFIGAGFLAVWWQGGGAGGGPPFTIDYYAENLTTGKTAKIASVPLTFPAGTLVPGTRVTFDTPLTITPLVNASTVVGLVGAGALRLTAQQSFGGAFPASAYITGPVIEIFS